MNPRKKPGPVKYAGKTWYYNENVSGYYVNRAGKMLHRKIYEDQVGPIPEGHVVHHRDGNKINNDPANLEAVTLAEHGARHRALKEDLSMSADWKNRIIETREMSPGELEANPRNWRKHTEYQAAALSGVLDDVGWVGQVIWNQRTGHLIDGHLRVELARKRKEKAIPANIVDLSEDEEALILATYDPIAALAESDKMAFAEIARSLETENAAIRALVERESEAIAALVDDLPDFSPIPEDDVPRLDEKKKVVCPECGHEFTP